jgi:hypothetical protein
VLPLADRRLRLDEMTPKASVGRASAALSTNELLWWGDGNGGEGGLFYRGANAARAGLCVPGESSVFSVFSSFRLRLISSSPRQVLRGFRIARPPVLENTAAREVRRLTIEENKRKKDEAKKRAHKRMVARDSLEKHNRAQAREGLPLEASPSTEDEGMEVCVGFSPEVGSRSALASVGPFVV